MEEINIRELKERITKKLTGLDITVSVAQVDKKDIEYRGKITKINPWESLDLSSGNHIPFVGISTGISQIRETPSGRLIYKNPEIEENYQDHEGEFQENYRKVNFACRDDPKNLLNAVPLITIRLRETGTFYID